MKTPGYRNRATGLLILLASVFASNLPMNAHAANFRLDTTPSLRMEEIWYSNVYNTSTDEVSSLGTRVTPTLALKFTSPDNVMLQLSGSYEKIWYNSSDAKDAESNTWYFRVDSSGGWRLTPTVSILPSVYYVNTTDSYRRTELLPSGDPLIPPASITNYGNTKSQDFGGALGFDFLVSPKVGIGVAGEYGYRRFPGDNVAGTGLTNSTRVGGRGSVSYILSPLSKLGLAVAAEHQTYDNGPNTDTYSAGILYGYQFSPVLRLDTTLGGSHIRQESTPGTPESSKWSPSGRFYLTYTTATFKATGFGDAGYSGGSGFGEATRQITAGLVLADQFTREWSWNLLGSYQVSKSVFISDSVNIRTKYAKGGLRYRPWEWGSLDLTGSLSRQTSDGLFGSNLDNYSAILGFTIGKPYNLY
ncbi:MAG: hypothetical protein IH588_03215 [Anaerolineales bacterium]|nr:hypothetical protein [Anaerolineales bacterium]